MAYIINYECTSVTKERNKSERKISNKAFLVATLISLIVLVWVITPVRVAVLDRFLPGKGEVTRKAVDQFVSDVKNGDSVKEAFTDFCFEIINNA